MTATYCHLCDADPCYCGQHGNITYVEQKAPIERGGRKGLDAAIREFVMSTHETGVRENWAGWLTRIQAQFGEEDAPRSAWSRVSNNLQREWVLISHPNDDRPMGPPSAFPEVRRVSLEEAELEVERLIDIGGWVAGDKGLRLWQVVERIPNVVYISIYDALHDMNRRGYRVTTKSPTSERNTQFWYVKA